REQPVLDEVEDQDRAHPVEREALPHLGEEQHEQAARVAEEGLAPGGRVRIGHGSGTPVLPAAPRGRTGGIYTTKSLVAVRAAVRGRCTRSSNPPPAGCPAPRSRSGTASRSPAATPRTAASAPAACQRLNPSRTSGRTPRSAGSTAAAA